ESLAGAAGLRSASDVRLVHWSPAEESNFEKAYESARSRHPDRDWPPLQWYDLLNRVFRAEPVVVRGAFSFSLKQVARAMHAAGLIETEWGQGLADGAGAMAGAWAAAAEERAGGRDDLDLVRLVRGDPELPGHVEREAGRAVKELGIGIGRAAREDFDVARAAVRSHPDPEDRAVTRVRDVQVGPARVERE